jgi:hypothetical protein
MGYPGRETSEALLPVKLAHISFGTGCLLAGPPLRFLFRRNREILETSALFGNVEDSA